jgi:hypothetical protein
MWLKTVLIIGQNPAGAALVALHATSSQLERTFR